MKKSCCLVWLLFMAFVVFAQQEVPITQANPDSFIFKQDTTYKQDSLAQDSLNRLFRKKSNQATLLDTISNENLMREVISPYLQLRHFYTEKPFMRVDLPTVKEIQKRPPREGNWKFWVICFVLLYISFVRIANQNNFRVFILSVFNLNLSEKIWDDQRSVFSFVILQLFAIYLFIAALFINYFMELKGYNPFGNYFTQYLAIVGVLVLVYLIKFMIHGFLGVLLKMNRLGIGFVANTVSVNNFLSLVIFPFIIFIIYNEDKILTLILTETVIAIFFIGVIYRMIRIAILSQSFFSFPKMYLFIYLCALEVAPWFVIIKFIKQFQI